MRQRRITILPLRSSANITPRSIAWFTAHEGRRSSTKVGGRAAALSSFRHREQLDDNESKLGQAVEVVQCKIRCNPGG